jgi:hypothetical protein
VVRAAVAEAGSRGMRRGRGAYIRASYVRKQKTDRRDAKHILQPLVEGRFPRIWIPDAEMRDHRQLLIHRHKLVRHAAGAAGKGYWRKRMPFCNGADRSCNITPLRKQADFQLVVVDERIYRIFEGGNRK